MCFYRAQWARLRVSGITGPLTIAVQNNRGFLTNFMSPWHKYFLSTNGVENLSIYVDRRTIEPLINIPLAHIVGLQSEFGEDVIINENRNKYSYTVSHFTVQKGTSGIGIHSLDTSSHDIVLCLSTSEKLHLK